MPIAGRQLVAEWSHPCSGLAAGRRNRTFCGTDSADNRAATMFPLVESCKHNGVNAPAWRADALASSAKGDDRIQSLWCQQYPAKHCGPAEASPLGSRPVPAIHHTRWHQPFDCQPLRRAAF
jgi:hypothetical protein